VPASRAFPAERIVRLVFGRKTEFFCAGTDIKMLEKAATSRTPGRCDDEAS